MTRRGWILRRILCVAIQCALLVPLSLGLAPVSEPRCLCGMKAGECSCELMMHARHSGKGGHCGGMKLQSHCSLRVPIRPPVSDPPQVSLDLRDRFGVLVSDGVKPVPVLVGVVAFLPGLAPVSVPRSPDPRPPRLSSSVA
jgi:hypothetical protein